MSTIEAGRPFDNRIADTGNVDASVAADERWPRWWRLALLAAGTLILCSCSAPQVARQPCGDPMSAAGMLPPEALAVDHPPLVEVDCLDAQAGFTAPSVAEGQNGGGFSLWDAPALPLIMAGAWAPPGLPLPWPADEYLRDGGDRGQRVRVHADWEIDGLDLEDTVAHYDTVTGERLVTPSNIVPIYAPRFGSVRLVTGALLYDQMQAAAGVELPTRLVQQQDNLQAATALQNEELIDQVGRRVPVARIGRQLDSEASRALGLAAFRDAFLPYENLAVIRQGIFKQSEKPYLAEGITAAIIWTKDQPVHVIIDGKAATEVAGDQRAQATYATGAEPGCPMLRIIKVASTQFANPGDEIDFTLRFDNVGTELVGNVTILDNLTTRLEYVPDTAQCSLKAEFFVDPNEGDSLLLRWEVDAPLRPGEGGICRFRCRVR